MPTERLLIPLDRSTVSEAAVPYARVLAAAAKLPVILLTVWEPVELEVADLAPDVVEDLRERGIRAGQEYLDGLAQGLRDAGLKVDLQVRVGRPADEILAAQEETGATLIVMATHGRAGLERVMYGSVADQVMRASPAPTLLVKPPAEHTTAAPAIRRIMVPLDGSELAAAALPYAVGWARRLGAELHLVRAIGWAAELYGAPIATYYPPNLDEELRQGGEAYLDRMRGQVEDGVPVRTQVLRGFAALAIQEYAREHHIDLIVMSTHGRGGIARAALGSTADRVVRSGVAPVLLVRVARGEGEG